ncbi:MAG: hypothetical protein K6A77_07585 [Clostridiales bacterium]|nr:hypothetical protein [Clostridiales bacterium]
MNLKEAFRFQNKLDALMAEATTILGRDENITKVKKTYLRKKVMKEAVDETTVDAPTTEYADKITQIAGFLLYLLEQKEALCRAIVHAKQEQAIDMDAEAGLNKQRQQVAALFRTMNDLRNGEIVRQNAGTGYRFNNDGEQVSYRCDVKIVTTINFDRNVIKRYAAMMNKKSDEISAEIDRALINSEVRFDQPFDVNDSFSEVFEAFLETAA